MADRRRILVADDDRQLVRTLVDVLRHRGFDAHGVHSGEAALAACTRDPWSAVVMDVKMGGRSGVETAKAMQHSWPRLPVVLITAYAQPQTLRDADDSGVERVLQKPFSPERLLRALDTALQQTDSVLIVDDDDQFLRTIGDTLGEQGCRTLRARTLDTALELLRARPTRLVLLDLVLPGVEPTAAAAAIRAVRPDVPVVLYSAHDDRLADAEAALPREWFRGVVKRPELLHRLPEFFDARRLA